MNVIIVIFCMFLLLMFIRKQKEHFQNSLNVNRFTINSINKPEKEIPIYFLTPTESCDGFKKNPQYFKQLNNTDKQARGNDVSYCNHVSAWTEEEKEICRNMIQLAQKRLQKYFILQKNLIYTPWKIAKVTGHVENGFPHTHDDIIYLSSTFLEKMMSNKTTQEIYDSIGFILLHEKVHVWQRKEPYLFENLYTKFLPFEKIKLNAESYKWLEKNSRTNPDGLDLNWVYTDKEGKYYVLMSMWNKTTEDIKSGSGPSDLSDITNLGIEVISNKTHDIWKIKNIENPTKISIPKLKFWMNEIGLTSNHYHPNEISAESISRLSVSNSNDNDILPPALKIKIEEWISSIPIV